MFADFARSIDLRADFMMPGCITVAIVLLRLLSGETTG